MPVAVRVPEGVGMSALIELLPRCRTGILFSGPLVLAILAGKKTVTRRMSKKWLKLDVGDLLFVRENWRLASYDMCINWDCRLSYEADGASLIHKVSGEQVVWLEREAHRRALWRRTHGGPTSPQHVAPLRPSIFLPRWASRCVLRVTEKPRLERVQDITEDDAKREGVDRGPRCDTQCNGPSTHGFMDTWHRLHTKPGERWQDGPEVVRIAFERAA